ncbi:MAG TPA: hypothetical protein VLA77_03050 [Candidatus Saccharimonadales bacterium]|nr:hypothetical protein [Candidatus Saccharimonadales bacterium]
MVWVLVALLLVAVFVAAMFALSKRNKTIAQTRAASQAETAERLAEFLRLIGRAESDDRGAMSDLFDNPSAWYGIAHVAKPTDLSKYYTLQDHYKAMQKADEVMQQFGDLLAQWQANPGTAKESLASVLKLIELARRTGWTYTGLSEATVILLECYQLPHDWLDTTLNLALKFRYDELLEGINEADSETFLELFNLVRNIERYLAYRRMGIGGRNVGEFFPARVTELPRPEGWNDLVARHVKHTQQSDFNWESPIESYAEARLAAVRALSSNSLTEVAMTLALLNSNNWHPSLADKLVAKFLEMRNAL